MVHHPWLFSQKALKAVNSAPPDQRQNVYDSYSTYYYNSFFVPSVIGYVILGAFGALVLLAAAARLARWALRPYLLRRRDGAAVRALKTHLIEAPLFRHHRARPYEAGKGVIVARAPGRLHLAGVLALVVINVLGLFAFYTTQPDAQSTKYGDRWSQLFKYFSDRAACLALAQLPIVILLSGRNSPVALLTGMHFNTQMLFHRWWARVLFFLALAHAVGYTIVLSREGEYKSHLAQAYVRWGIAAVSMFASLCFFSLTFFRRISYEVFLVLHILFLVMAIVSVYKHLFLNGESLNSDFYDYIWAAISFWVFDRAMRLARVVLLNFSIFGRGANGHMSQARSRILADGTLHMRIFPAGWGAKRLLAARPGQHISVNCPAVQPLSMHPYSVITQGTDEERRPYLDVCIQPREGFTRRMARRIKRSSHNSYDCKAVIEGPYGTPIDISGYRSIVMLAGGIGITHCLSILLHALRTHSEHETLFEQGKLDAEKGTGLRRKIVLVWAYRDQRSFATALPYLLAAKAELDSLTSPPDLFVRCFASRTEAGLASFSSAGASPTVTPVDSSDTLAGDGAVSPVSSASSAATVVPPSPPLVGVDDSKQKLPGRPQRPTGARLATLQDDVLTHLADGDESVTRDFRLLRHSMGLRFYGTGADLHEELLGAVDGSDSSAAPPAHYSMFCRTAVISCGPDRFSDEVRSCVRHARDAGRADIDFLEECFAW